jgi:hypothetical protein
VLALPGPTPVADALAVLMQPESEEEGLGWLQHVRRMASAAAYLAPVFCLIPEGKHWPRLKAAVDGLLDGAAEDSEGWRTEAHRIRSRIKSVDGNGSEAGMAERILRLAYTRNIEIKPIPDVTAALGYSYPQVQALSELEARDALAFLVEQQLLSAEFVDRVHTCQGCGSGRLNFREICPSCGSANIGLSDLVHHFRCAYIGPVTDFGALSHKTCPKCGHGLHDLGVDYDIPGKVATCHTCGETTQAPETQALCLSCGLASPPELLELVAVNLHKLTPAGEAAALHGLAAMLRTQLARETLVLPPDVFDLLVDLEQARIQRYGKSRSCTVQVRLEPSDLSSRLGASAAKTYSELAKILSEMTRTSDAVTVRGEAFFEVYLPETATDGAHVFASRLKARVDDLLLASLGRAVSTRCDVTELNA